ncbi:proteasome non-ATPase 26S subunit-domain-containing protein, partial [Jimgerdemannia flammicorona]
SAEAFERTEAAGLLDGVVGEIKSHDLLVKLNAMEMIAQLAITQSGYTFLERSGVIGELAEVLRAEDDADVAVTLVKCAALKFFGALAGVEDVDFAAVQESHAVFKQITLHLDSRNMEVKITTLAVVGLIGSTPRGLRLLHEQKATPRLLDAFVGAYRPAVGDVRIAALQALSHLLRGGEYVTPEISDITESLYRELRGNPTTIDSLLTHAKSPVEDLRVAAFSVIEAVAGHPWGRKELAGSKTFVDWIFNRGTEGTHSGKMEIRDCQGPRLRLGRRADSRADHAGPAHAVCPAGAVLCVHGGDSGDGERVIWLMEKTGLWDARARKGAIGWYW